MSLTEGSGGDLFSSWDYCAKSDVEKRELAPRIQLFVRSSSWFSGCGYGSLVWNRGFDYDDKMIGYIKNYRRVFDLGMQTLPVFIFIHFYLNLVIN
uniref:Gamma-glutamylcyclotransferase n=1 Tax=Lactuca sativa TaxID=4236 RepID=A0A9R1W3E2_LACSA|nr:hypothetical protein LSAT_V11C300141090 [Lactuca sativa]